MIRESDRLLNEMIISSDADAVVDLGCGLGQDLAKMMEAKRSETTKYIGVDQSRSMLQQCQEELLNKGQAVGQQSSYLKWKNKEEKTDEVRSWWEIATEDHDEEEELKPTNDQLISGLNEALQAMDDRVTSELKSSK